MKRKIFLQLVLCTIPFFCFAGQISMTAQVHNYKGNKIYFDCLQTPHLFKEFHTNPGEVHEYTFDAEKIVLMRINERVKVLLESGDSLHVVVQYQGRNEPPLLEYSGTEQAVFHNRLYQRIDKMKREMRYRNQLLASVVVDVKPKDRIADSKTLREKVSEIIDQAGSKCSQAIADYILAETDAAVYLSFMEYPVMYEDTRKVPIDQQEIGDYWSLMDNFSLLSTSSAMRCPEYASMLMYYCFYSNKKTARSRGEQYTMPRSFEETFDQLAQFAPFDDRQRSFVLYTLLTNYVRNAKDIDKIDSYVQQYLSRYNKDQEQADILESLLQ